MRRLWVFLILTIVHEARAEEIPCVRGGDRALTAVTGPAAQLEKQLDCFVSVACADGKPFLAAQKAVDADLMSVWLAKRGKLTGTVVAVLDTGFDKQRIDAGEIRIELTKALRRGPANSDELGHGTAVTSLITGTSGIGVSPNARVRGLRVTNLQEGSPPGVLLKAKALEACRDGAEIINVSFGSVVAFEKDKEFVRELSERGCFLVKGAGNLGFEQALSEDSWDRRDPILRVEGIDPVTGKRPRRYDRGEWSAPGVELTTLGPRAAKSSTRCGELAIQRNSGSSGAAPIFSGILAEVLSVLRTGPWHASLPGPKRIELVTHILDASRVTPGGISGYRAVRLAGELAGRKGIGDSLEAAVERASKALAVDCGKRQESGCAARARARLCQK